MFSFLPVWSYVKCELVVVFSLLPVRSFVKCDQVVSVIRLSYLIICLLGPVLSASRLLCTDCLLPVWSFVQCEYVVVYRLSFACVVLC